MKRAIDLSGLSRIGEHLKRLEKIDYTPLMKKWEEVIDDDNRYGVLAGLDKDGAPLAPVTYRPRPGATKRRVPRKKGGFKSFGSDLNGNLTSSEYRQLSGPPLAPRGARSRVITNLVARNGRQGGVYFVEAAWADIVDVKGRPFFQYLLKGGGRLPARNVAGVREWGREKAKALLLAFVLKILRRA